MKKNIHIILFIFTSTLLNAQQRPHYTQYILNNYILNPALSGIENYTDVKLSMRDQWIGLNGAPRSTYLSIHSPISKSDYRTSVTSFEIPGQNPRGQAYWENYTAAKPHHGIGFMAINDLTGSLSHFTANITYAYHIGLNATTNLSGGFSAGIKKFSINRSKNDFGSGSSFDPAIGSSSMMNLYTIKPDFGVGFWLYSRNYFVGVSSQQVIPQNFTFDNAVPVNMKGRLIPHLFFTGGYRFLLNEDINAIPSIMTKYIYGSSKYDFQIETNLKLQYHDFLWIGGSYRHRDGYAAMIGFNIANSVNFGYSYDFTQSPLNTVSKGTHEIILGFILGNRYGSSCPQSIW